MIVPENVIVVTAAALPFPGSKLFLFLFHFFSSLVVKQIRLYTAE